MFLFALHPSFAEAPDLTGPRHAAIRVLERRVRATPRPGELLRLAELWQQDAEALELAAFADQVARFDRCHDTPGCDPSTILADLSAANRAREHATARYLRLLRDFPTAAEADDAAYGLGWAWRAMGEAALGDAAFTWLVAAHPESEYAADAWLIIGEQAFEQWEAEWARHAYTQVLAGDDARRSWAGYRLGWSYYRLGDYAQAIETMKVVVREGMATPKPAPPGSIDMTEEALKDLVRFYADAGEMDEWYGGPGLGRETTRGMLARLADIFVEQGNHDQAIQMWRRLIATDPSNAGVPTLYARIVEAYRTLAQLEAAVDELERLRREIDARATLAGAPDPAHEALLERGVRNVAFDLHRWGRSGESSRRIEQALQLYTFHAARFPGAEHAPELAWGRAVALEDLGAYGEAAARYRALAESDPVGRYAREAAAAAARLEGR